MSTKSLHKLACVTALGLMAAFGSGSGAEETPKRGLQVGEYVPITSMRCIVGEPADRNTCLAGKYRKKHTISIYARSVDEKHLDALVQSIEAMLSAKPDVRGYILLLQGSQRDEGLKNGIRAWMKEQKSTHLDVAISNGDPQRLYKLGPEMAVAVVYSEQLEVKYFRAFETGKFNETGVKEVVDALQKTAR